MYICTGFLRYLDRYSLHLENNRQYDRPKIFHELRVSVLWHLLTVYMSREQWAFCVLGVFISARGG